MLDHVARRLGNTPAVARKSYVHPALVEAARSRDLAAFRCKLPRKTRWLSACERGLLSFLQQRPCPL